MEQEELAEVIPLDGKAREYLLDMPDEVLQKLSFSMPWQYDDSEKGYRDPDKGLVTGAAGDKATRDALQDECWDKFNKNPQFSSAIRDQVGRIGGLGFATTSGVWEIHQNIQNIYYDPRNRLYNYLPKYIGRAFVEGELYIILTLHPNGFVEVDFSEPKELSSKGDDNTGIIYHPDKPHMPLFYLYKDAAGNVSRQVPSIFVGMYPELSSVAARHPDYNRKLQSGARTRSSKYNNLNKYKRFVVSWDRGYMTRRNVSYLRTVLEWLNYYENLKKFEIDHKKSSGSYVWVFSFEDARSFKLWLSLSDEERRKTAILSKMTPGGKLVLPPGMSVKAESPVLPTINDQDTDILQMVSSGMGIAEDQMTGSAKGTFATVKASRGPVSDRTADEIAYWDRFYKYDFWGSVFFLQQAIGAFPATFPVKEAVDWNAKQEAIFKNVPYRPEFLIDVTYPVSEMIDTEARSKGLLGAKHGPVAETLGIPNSEVAKRLGFGGYDRLRLMKATEDGKYPELVYTIDAESIQETVEGEPKKKTDDKKKEKNSKLKR